MLLKIINFVNPIKRREAVISPKAKLFNRVKKNQTDIILIAAVILISLISFGIGYITAEQQNKEPIRFELNNND